MCVCMFAIVSVCVMYAFANTYFVPGLFSSLFWEQGFDEVRERDRTLKLFEGFNVQFWNMGPWTPPPTFESSQLVVYVYN